MDNRNLIAALALVALIMVAATTAGCTTNTTSSPTPTSIPAKQTDVGDNTTFSSAAGFNITFPKSLKTDSSINASQPIRLYIYLGNQTGTFDGVVVATNDLKPGSTLNEYVKWNRDSLKINATLSNYQNFTILNDTNTTFAGKPAHTLVWSGIIPVAYSATDQRNMSVKVMQTFVVNNNVGYAITYKASPPTNYDKYLPTAQRIMNSFVLTS